MNFSLILLGTNKGNKLENLQKAISNLVNSGVKIIISSSIYETAAWGNTNQDSFYNKVIKINTELSPVDLMTLLLSIENKMGRIRNEVKWQPRVIDLDILFYNDEIITSEFLTVPHPFLHQRKFTLVPLVEIASNEIHPILKLNVLDLLNNCDDNSKVKKLEPLNQIQ